MNEIDYQIKVWHFIPFYSLYLYFVIDNDKT